MPKCELNKLLDAPARVRASASGSASGTGLAKIGHGK